MKIASLLFLALQPLLVRTFSPCAQSSKTRRSTSTTTAPTTCLSAIANNNNNNQKEAGGSSSPGTTLNRRRWMQQSVRWLCSTAVVAASTSPVPAWAAVRPPLDDLLYTILRVREATEQESRLIRTGKFKDVQRANVKLAVRFMVENYRLADAFVSAAAYLDGNDRRIAAGEVGQAAVQNLVTILEYFDSSDVQNLKVGSNAMSGKEALVLKGLDAARKNIDEFLTYFPAGTIDGAKAKIESENKLNVDEFDPELGAPINLPPKT